MNGRSMTSKPSRLVSRGRYNPSIDLKKGEQVPMTNGTKLDKMSQKERKRRPDENRESALPSLAATRSNILDFVMSTMDEKRQNPTLDKVLGGNFKSINILGGEELEEFQQPYEREIREAINESSEDTDFMAETKEDKTDRIRKQQTSLERGRVSMAKRFDGKGGSDVENRTMLRFPRENSDAECRRISEEIRFMIKKPNKPESLSGQSKTNNPSLLLEPIDHTGYGSLANLYKRKEGRRGIQPEAIPYNGQRDYQRQKTPVRLEPVSSLVRETKVSIPSATGSKFYNVSGKPKEGESNRLRETLADMKEKKNSYRNENKKLDPLQQVEKRFEYYGKDEEEALE